MSPWHKAMPMADWPNFPLSLIKPCDLHAGSHAVESSAPGGEKIAYDKLWLADSIPVNKS